MEDCPSSNSKWSCCKKKPLVLENVVLDLPEDGDQGDYFEKGRLREAHFSHNIMLKYLLCLILPICTPFVIWNLVRRNKRLGIPDTGQRSGHVGLVLMAVAYPFLIIANYISFASNTPPPHMHRQESTMPLVGYIVAGLAVTFYHSNVPEMGYKENFGAVEFRKKYLSKWWTSRRHDLLPPKGIISSIKRYIYNMTIAFILVLPHCLIVPLYRVYRGYGMGGGTSNGDWLFVSSLVANLVIFEWLVATLIIVFMGSLQHLYGLTTLTKMTMTENGGLDLTTVSGSSLFFHTRSLLKGVDHVRGKQSAGFILTTTLLIIGQCIRLLLMALLKEFSNTVKSSSMEDIGMIWTAIEDFLYHNVSTKRKSSFVLLHAMISSRRTAFGPLRKLVMNALGNVNMDEIKNMMDILRLLTTDWTDIKNEEDSIANLLSDWLSRLDLRTGSEEEKDVIQTLTMIIQHHFALLKQATTVKVVSIVTEAGTKATTAMLVSCVLQFLEVLVRYGLVPRQCLPAVVTILCSAVNTYVGKISDESQSVMRVLFRRSGHQTVRLMCTMMENPHNMSNPPLLRGLIYFLGSYAWGKKRLPTLEIPFSSIIPSMVAAVKCDSDLVTFEVAMALLRLLTKHGRTLVVEWGPLLNLFETLYPIAKRSENPALREVLVEFSSIIEAYYQSGVFRGMLTVLHDILSAMGEFKSEPATLLYLDLETRELTPQTGLTRPDWQLRTSKLLRNFVQRPGTPNAVKRRALKLAQSVTEASRGLYEDECISGVVITFIAGSLYDDDIVVRNRSIEIFKLVGTSYRRSKRLLDVISALETGANFQPKTSEKSKSGEDERLIQLGLSQSRADCASAIVSIFEKRLVEFPGSLAQASFEALIRTASARDPAVRRIVWDGLSYLRAIPHYHVVWKTNQRTSLRIVGGAAGDWKKVIERTEEEKHSEGDHSHAGTGLVNSTAILECILNRILNETETDIMNVVLHTFSDMLLNRFILCKGEKSILASIARLLCSDLSQGQFGSGLAYKEADDKVQSYVLGYECLVKLVGYGIVRDDNVAEKDDTDSVRASDLIAAFVGGLALKIKVGKPETSERLGKICMQGLLQTRAECGMLYAPRRIAASLIDDIGPIMADPKLRVAVLSFFSGLGQHYVEAIRLARGMAAAGDVLVGEKARSVPPNSVYTIPDYLARACMRVVIASMDPAQSKYIRLLAHRCVRYWFHAIEIGRRHLYVDLLLKGLAKWAPSDPLVSVTLESVLQYCYSDVNSAPPKTSSNSLLSFLFAHPVVKSWLIGSRNVLTIKCGRMGWAEITVRGSTMKSLMMVNVQNSVGDYVTRSLSGCMLGFGQLCFLHDYEQLPKYLGGLDARITESQSQTKAQKPEEEQLKSPEKFKKAEVLSTTTEAKPTVSLSLGRRSSSTGSLIEFLAETGRQTPETSTEVKPEVKPDDSVRPEEVKKKENIPKQSSVEQDLMLLMHPLGGDDDVEEVRRASKSFYQYSRRKMRAVSDTTSGAAAARQRQRPDRTLLSTKSEVISEVIQNPIIPAAPTTRISEPAKKHVQLSDSIDIITRKDTPLDRKREESGVGLTAEEQMRLYQKTVQATLSSEGGSFSPSPSAAGSATRSATRSKMSESISPPVPVTHGFTITNAPEKNKPLSGGYSQLPSNVRVSETGERLGKISETSAFGIGYEDDDDIPESQLAGDVDRFFDVEKIDHSVWEDTSVQRTLGDQKKKFENWSSSPKGSPKPSPQASPRSSPVRSRNLQQSSKDVVTVEPLRIETRLEDSPAEAEESTEKEKEETLAPPSAAKPPKSPTIHTHKDSSSGGSSNDPAPSAQIEASKALASSIMSPLHSYAISSVLASPPSEKLAQIELPPLLSAPIVDDPQQFEHRPVTPILPSVEESSTAGSMLKSLTGGSDITQASTLMNMSSTKTNILPDFVLSRILPSLVQPTRENEYKVNNAGSDLITLEAGTTLSTELRVLDYVLCVDTCKAGVLYTGPGQHTEEEILKNQHGSARYRRFLQKLGQIVPLKGYTGFSGGLNTSDDEDGKLGVVWQNPCMEIAFHVATFMPLYSHDPSATNKKMHIGNDYVNIMYLDAPETEFSRLAVGVLTGQFNFVQIWVRPLDRGFYRVSVKKRLFGLPEFCPGNDPMIVSEAGIGIVIRQLVINASLAAENLKAEKLNHPHKCWAEQRAERISAIHTKFENSQ